eukprot:227613-Rhodomonas_salina.1
MPRYHPTKRTPIALSVSCYELHTHTPVSSYQRHMLEIEERIGDFQRRVSYRARRIMLCDTYACFRIMLCVTYTHTRITVSYTHLRAHETEADL